MLKNKILAGLVVLSTVLLSSCGNSVSQPTGESTTQIESIEFNAQGVFPTDAAAAKKAAELGYSKTSARSHEQAVFYRSKARRDIQYITRDIDSHSGGAWKGASSVANLGSKNTRSGTYNINLVRIGD